MYVHNRILSVEEKDVVLFSSRWIHLERVNVVTVGRRHNRDQRTSASSSRELSRLAGRFMLISQQVHTSHKGEGLDPATVLGNRFRGPGGVDVCWEGRRLQGHGWA